MIAGLPGQFAWALDATPEVEAVGPADVVVVGMGGSGISGDVARAVLYMDIRYEGGEHAVNGLAEPDLVLTDGSEDQPLVEYAEVSDVVGGMDRDTTLVAKIKASLFKVDIEDFDPTRVKVTASDGNVYLMGLLTRAEGQAVVEHVRGLSGVKKVVEIFEYIG